MATFASGAANPTCVFQFECASFNAGVLHGHYLWMQLFFCLQLEASLLTVELFDLQLAILAFLLTVGAFLLTVLAFALTIGAFVLTVGKCI